MTGRLWKEARSLKKGDVVVRQGDGLLMRVDDVEVDGDHVVIRFRQDPPARVFAGWEVRVMETAGEG